MPAPLLMPRKPKPRPDVEGDQSERGPGERLQKVLAAAGVGSRRDCEELITAGRVAVDGQVVTELGTRVDPLTHEIRVDGEALRQPKRQYFAVNKPIGFVTTNFDPGRRSRVIDLVPTEERVFAVGRLDRSSEGLILVTNDGEFANRVTHPRYGVEKTYLVRVAGAPDHRQLERLKRGVHLAEGFARAASIAVKKKHGQSTDLVIVLNEGRNREIRRILARVGHKVLALKRIAVGPIKLADLPLGGWRRLMDNEVEALLAVAKEKRRAAKRGKPAGAVDRGSGIGDREPRVGTPARSASEANQRDLSSVPDESGYLQKQALLAEPLSLDDLLRDDLDEGPLPPSDAGDAGQPKSREAGQGGVIDYEDEFSTPPPAGPPARQRGERAERGKRPERGSPERGKRPRADGRPSQRGERSQREQLPRETFGKKRGGKRVYGPPHEGRGPAGEKAGNFRFRKKHNPKKKAAAAEDRPAGRQGGRGGRPKTGKPAGKPPGKSGGKRRGRR